MNTEVTVHITYDDLSEECKRKIDRLKGQGTTVRIKWPLNELYSVPYEWPFQTLPSIQPTMPIEPLKTDDIDWTTGDTTVYCHSNNSNKSKKNLLASIME